VVLQYRWADFRGCVLRDGWGGELLALDYDSHPWDRSGDPCNADAYDDIEERLGRIRRLLDEVMAPGAAGVTMPSDDFPSELGAAWEDGDWHALVEACLAYVITERGRLYEEYPDAMATLDAFVPERLC
jgi:hypothetical protein